MISIKQAFEEKGNKCLISIEEIRKDILFSDSSIIEKIDAVSVCDVTLERVEGDGIVSIAMLNSISEAIASFLFLNPNVILYYYCDEKDVKRRDSEVLPQEYRSNLFSAMFARRMERIGSTDITDYPIMAESVNGPIYIHIIAWNKHAFIVEQIKDMILDQSK